MHRPTASAAPIAFLFLMLPAGICTGFVGVTLPFALTTAGFSVAASLSIVALALSATLWGFLVAPVADLTLTLRRRYAIGLVTSAGMLCLLTLMPLRPALAGVLTIVAFLMLIACSMVGLPTRGLMAHTVRDDQQGRASIHDGVRWLGARSIERGNDVECRSASGTRLRCARTAGAVANECPHRTGAE